MRYTVVAIAGIFLLSGGAVAEEASPQIVAHQSPSLSESAPKPDVEPGVGGYQLVAIATGAVAGVIAANFITGGMISPILLYGNGATVPAAAAASPGAVGAMVAVQAISMAFDLLIVAAAPTAAASVAGPVHAELGDGYATPESYLLAVEDSIGAAGTAATEVEAYVRTAVGEWWYGQ